MKRRIFSRASGLLLAVVFWGCSDGLHFPETNPPEPDRSAGAIRIVTSTTGFDLQGPSGFEADGYLWKLDHGDGREIGPNDAARVASIQAGEHVIELTDLPEGCSVRGENPRSVMVKAGGQAEVVFEVDCSLAPR